MKNSIISTGNQYRIYDSSVETHDTLPIKTFKIAFDPMSGYSLVATNDLDPGNEKVYGQHSKKLNRIMDTYKQTDRSLGIILSGDKGIGKSLMVRLLSEQAMEAGLPVIIVEQNTPGLSDFIDSLEEVLVIFDEFEKKFKVSPDNESNQDQFLGLFDGMSSQKRMYAVTVNDVGKLSQFLVNRPGRFHYHIRFEYPTAAEVTEYITDMVPGISPLNVEAVVAFSQRAKINYDHLRAVAMELRNTGEDFEDIIGDLNIKRLEPLTYEVAIYKNEEILWAGTTRSDLYGDEHRTFQTDVQPRKSGLETIFVSTTLGDIFYDSKSAQHVVLAENMKDHYYDESDYTDNGQEAPGDPIVNSGATHMTFKIKHQTNYSY